MTLPALVVKLDDGSGSFPFDISSKVMGADGYDVSRGRDDWQGAVTAGELGLTLNNSDGRFTPGSTILATPSPIKVDQRIRVIEYVGDGFGVDGFGTGPFGGYVIRFTGYVKSWPVSWPATVATFSTVSLTATDAQARSERRTLRSMLEEEILLDAPSGFWPLSEAEGALSGGDLSGNAPVLRSTSASTPTFGAPVNLPDGNTGITLTGTTRLTSALTGSLSTLHLEFEFVTTETDIGMAQIDVPALSFRARIFLQSGRLWLNGGGLGGNVDTGVTPAPGLPHIGSLEADNVATWLWLDGVRIGGALPAHSAFDLSTLQFGAGTGGTIPTGLTIAMANVGPKISDARVTAHHAAALSQLAGESGTARVARLAGYAGIPVGTLDTSLTVVPGQDTAGRSAQDAIQEVADGEMGLVFIDGSGSLAFHNRNRVRAKAAPDLILDSQYVTPDVQPVTDDQQIVNYFEATAAGTGAAAVVRSATSETTHGRYPVSQTYLVQTDAEAVDRASWIVTKQAEPTARFGTLTINLYKMTAAMAANVVAAIDLNCWLRVTSMATQTPGGTVVDVVVQGWRVAATGESWAITCNVVARALYTAFVLNSSLLDSTTPLAV